MAYTNPDHVFFYRIHSTTRCSLVQVTKCGVVPMMSMNQQKTAKGVIAEKFRDKDFIKIIVLEKK